MEPIEWLTLALVLITAFYAWQTQQTVREMKTSRRLSVLPDLRPDLHTSAVGNVATFSLTNTGQGPAIDVNVRLIYKATRAVAGTTTEYTWRAHTIAPGERHEFYPPMVEDEQPTTIDQLVDHFSEFRVRGEMKDSMDTVHSVDLELDRFKEYRDIEQESGHARSLDPATRTADALQNILRAMNQTVRQLAAIKRAIEEREEQSESRHATSWGRPNAAPEPEDVPF